jgi:NAD(P)-dependent dehydrogenase (short-subunit alcohol dehydrogenase family)
MATPFGHTTDGFELQIGVNHLGHFLLTSLLLPRLLDSNQPRIVTLSSSAHFMGGVDLDDLNYQARPYAPWPAYGQSKTANILFTLELRRRYADRNLLACAVHPGFVDTDLFRYLGEDEMAGMDQQAATHDEPKKTPAQGAATTLYAATADPAELADAPYLADCAPSRAVARHARDTDVAQRLWELSEQLVGTSSPS